ncbi:MAG: hypothetical protein ACK559_30115, partial [bacterium]
MRTGLVGHAPAGACARASPRASGPVAASRARVARATSVAGRRCARGRVVMRVSSGMRGDARGDSGPTRADRGVVSRLEGRVPE